MKITLNNFRCYANNVYFLEQGKVTLISGPSGAGKSTILSAICWCLFGGIRNIYSNTNTDTKTKTSVLIELPGYSIYRQGRPGLLRVTIGLAIYEDQIAQKIIEQQFGNKDLWKACSYVEQGSKCTLLTGTNIERMEVLNGLSFSSINPEEYVNKIDAELSSLQDSYKTDVTFFNSEYQRFTEMVTEAGTIDPAQYLTLDQIEHKKQDLDQLVITLKSLTQIRLQQHQLRGRASLLEETLSQKRTTLSKFSDIKMDIDINTIETNLILLKQQFQELGKTRLQQHQFRGQMQTLKETLSKKELIFSQIAEQISHIDNIPTKDICQQQISYIEEQLTQVIIKIRQFQQQIREQQRLDERFKSLTQFISQKAQEIMTLRMKMPSNTELEQIKSKINDLENQINNASINNSNYLELQQLRQKRDSLEKTGRSQFPNLWDHILNSNNIITAEMVANFNNQDRLYQNNASIASKLGIKYDIETINTTINNLRKQIQYDVEITQLQPVLIQIKEIENKLTNMSFTIGIDESTLAITRNKVNQLNNAIDLLKCPHCEGSVRYLDRKLIKSDQTPVTPEQLSSVVNDLKLMETQFRQNQNIINLQKQRDQLLLLLKNQDRDQIDQYQPINTNLLNQRISELQKIEVVTSPNIPGKLAELIFLFQQLKADEGKKSFIEGLVDVTSLQLTLVEFQTKLKQGIDDISRYQHLQNELAIYQAQLEEIKPLIKSSTDLDLRSHEDEKIKLSTELKQKQNLFSLLTHRDQLIEDIKITRDQLSQMILIPDIDQQYDRLEKQIGDTSSIIQQIKQRQELLVEIDSLTNQINNLGIIPDIDQQVIDIEARYLKETKILERGKHLLKLQQMQAELENKHTSLFQLQQDIETVGRLRQLAIDVECRQLQTTVNSINLTIAEILSHIFEHPISVTLRLYKQIKTDKRIKSSVNLAILYKGAEYDGINQLSGGEQDRISLALVLALNQISSSPILMLDEVASSLDGNLRSLCLESIRSTIGINKIVICINHEEVEGNYDQVVQIN